MAKRTKDKARVPTDGTGQLTAHPFGGLGLALRDSLPAGASVPPADLPTEDPLVERSVEPSWGKIVLRREKKGRGGKVVTIVEGIPGPVARRVALLAELRRELGCGGSLEDDALVFAGEHAPRLEACLRARGARQVVRGS